MSESGSPNTHPNAHKIVGVLIYIVPRRRLLGALRLAVPDRLLLWGYFGVIPVSDPLCGRRVLESILVPQRLGPRYVVTYRVLPIDGEQTRDLSVRW